MFIRRTKDIQTIHELHALTFPHDVFYEHDDNHYWLAYDRNKSEPIGFAMATDYGEGVLFLSRVGVLEEYRGRGLHRRLIRVRENFAKKHNFNSIITYTTNGNFQSFSNLIKIGYEMYEPEYSYASKSCFYFRKVLREA